VGTPIGTYITASELPSEANELASVLEAHSDSQIDINLKSEGIPLSLIREASIIQARNKIKSQLTPDKDLIQSIEALDEAHETINVVSERLTAWYTQVTGKPRTNVEEILEQEPLPSRMVILKDFYMSNKALIAGLSEYLDREAPKVFPNLVNVLGTQLAVRIVAAVGSLSRLARLPSSTIQLLGAEKALFRHMSDGSPPPKHGILYQHPSVKQAVRKDKGRVSRKLAAKVAIASKIEYYGDKNE
jgi:nucleolar protein 56